MTSAAFLVLLVPTLLTAVIGYVRPDLRRSMFWAGLLAIPVLLAFPLTFHFINFPFGLLRLLTLFMFGAVAAAIYELVFSKYFRMPGRSRQPLLWMLIGPVVFLFGVMLAGQTIGPLVVALLLEIGLVIAFRRDLLWDLVFSGGAMAVLYVLVVVILIRVVGTPTGSNFIAGSNFSGVTLWGIPWEEILAVALFGALWGPMYPAFKDMKLKK